MKKQLIFIILSIICIINSNAQSTEHFNYQAVVRDNLGAVVENQNVNIRINILKSSSSGSSVFSEEHNVTTNQFGLVNLEIGGGNLLIGDFTGINWGADIYFLQIELDPSGGTSYQLMGVSQLLAVPYALYSKSSADSSLWEQNGSDIYYNQGNVGIGALTPNGKLLVKSDAGAGVNDDIFSVLNANGDTVFAVYQEGVRIYVDDNGGTKANGNRGGFAVGGFSPTKAGFTNEFLRVTPDSVRVYINDDFVGSKATGSRGGFAVGGFSPAKGAITDDYFFVQDDSTRIWTDGDGGFEILDIATGSINYLDLTPSNYFIGHESGDLISSGLFNSTLGYQSGYNLLQGSNNSFIGYQSGYGTNNGTGNLFIGYQSGYSNTTGSYNTFLGYKSGYLNLGGLSNSFLGSLAGYNNTSGNNNTFVGDSTGFYNTTGNENSFFGDKAGFSNVSGDYNVFIGDEAGYGNTYGLSNVFIGNHAGYLSSGSEYNVFIGHKAGYNTWQGWSNVFIGYESGLANTQGVSNVFIGEATGRSNSYGESNVFIGTSAGHDNTSGSWNVHIGTAAGVNSNASDNIFVGYASGYETTTGHDNIFVGNQSGDNNTTGMQNIYIGTRTGYLNTTGTGNTFIGYQTGWSETGSNKLYIDNSNTTNPLIFGDFGTDKVQINHTTGLPSSGFFINNYNNVNYWSFYQYSTNALHITYNGASRGSWDVVSGAYTAISDKRLKKNIEDLDNVLDKLKLLEAKTYNFISQENDDKKYLGFIAQDAIKLFPSLVYHTEGGEGEEDVYMVDYSGFSVVAIQAIKEQQKIIEKLEKEKEEMAKLNTDILIRLEKVEALLNSSTKK